MKDDFTNSKESTSLFFDRIDIRVDLMDDVSMKNERNDPFIHVIPFFMVNFIA